MICEILVLKIRVWHISVLLSMVLRVIQHVMIYEYFRMWKCVKHCHYFFKRENEKWKEPNWMKICLLCIIKKALKQWGPIKHSNMPWAEHRVWQKVVNYVLIWKTYRTSVAFQLLSSSPSMRWRIHFCVASLQAISSTMATWPMKIWPTLVKVSYTSRIFPLPAWTPSLCKDGWYPNLNLSFFLGISRTFPQPSPVSASTMALDPFK